MILGLIAILTIVAVAYVVVAIMAVNTFDEANNSLLVMLNETHERVTLSNRLIAEINDAMKRSEK